jgi:adenylate cyclase
LASPPLAVKWTLAIGSLLIAGMGMLGWYLIGQQEVAFERYAAQLGQVLTEQLARAAGEPLLADDTLMLESLAHRQLDDELVVGVGIYDLNQTPRAVAGVIPNVAVLTPLLAQTDSAHALNTQWQLQTEGGEPVAALPYLSPIRFQDVLTGHVLLNINRLPLERDRRALIQVLVISTVVLIAVVGVLAFPLARWMSEPIRHLARTGGLPSGAWPVTTVTGQRGDELAQLARQIALLSQDAESKRLVEDALCRYLSPGVARSVLAAPEGLHLGGRSIRGSVLFCDIVDFTQLSRSLSPEQVGGLVNDYFGSFARAGGFCLGTVDKFIGDCVMILFGVPEPDERHALNAIVCGQAIMRLADGINRRRERAGLPTVRFRLAINSGLMLAGNLGSRERMEFTVVGNSVNLASRLCEQAPTGQLVVTPDTLAEPGVIEQVFAKSLPAIELKGYDRPMHPYLIEAASEDFERQVQACVQAVAATAPERA